LPVALTEIKKLEILKGPAAAVYGFNAFDGIVNIITKSPEEMKGTTLQVAADETGTLLTTAVHAGTTGNLGFRLSGGHEQTQRWLDRDIPALNGQRFGGLVEYYLASDGKIRGEAGFTRSSPYNSLTNPLSSEDIHFSQTYGLVSYEKRPFDSRLVERLVC